MIERAETQDEGSSPLIRALEEVKECTPPLARFVQEFCDLMGLFSSFISMATRLDDRKGMTRKLYDTVLQFINPDEEYRYSETYRSMENYGGQFSRNMTVGMANNFLSYISEVLQLVLAARPEILRSSERLTTEEILQFSDIKDIVAYVADRKINELSYGGLKGVEAYLRDRLGLELFENSNERMHLSILAELRNIYTHNRGIVNRLFLTRIGSTSHDTFKFVLGEPYAVDLIDFNKLAVNAITVASRLDKGLTRKFGIATEPLNLKSD